jgi:hypothetical protein
MAGILSNPKHALTSQQENLLARRGQNRARLVPNRQQRVKRIQAFAAMLAWLKRWPLGGSLNAPTKATSASFASHPIF